MSVAAPAADAAGGAASAAAAHPHARRSRLLTVAAVLAVLVVAVRLLAAEPFEIPSDSMAPTLRPGDHVLVDKLAYKGGEPARGDLAVFHEPGTGTILLKRVVAVEGQVVGLEDGVLVVDGRRQDEPWSDPDLIDSIYFGPVRVPPGAVFVLGDNRRDSRDSRRFGAVHTREMIGRARARIWPPSRWGGT